MRSMRPRDELRVVANQSEANKHCKKSPTYQNPQYIDPNILVKPEESKYIMDVARPQLKDSTLIGKTKINHQTRSSKSWFMPSDDKVARRVIGRVLEWLRTHEGLHISPEQCERLQVVRYTQGQKYKPHHDNCVSSKEVCDNFKKNGGDRIITVILGLNEQGTDYTGGHTSFPKLGVKYRLPPTGGLMFYSMNKEGTKSHPFSLHGGESIHSGEKWIANIWIREFKRK